MHVPNWGDQQTSYQPTTVFDARFFWVKVEHGVREGEDEPMSVFTGLCDRCAVNKIWTEMIDFENHKNCPNCSANYTLRSFGGTTEKQDISLRIYLAHTARAMYEGDPDWLSCDANANLKGFMRGAMSVLLYTDIGKALSQYGFVRMYPSAAAKMLETDRGHLIVTTRFQRESREHAFYRFSYDCRNRLYAAYMSMHYYLKDLSETHSAMMIPRKRGWGMRSKLFWGCSRCGTQCQSVFP